MTPASAAASKTAEQVYASDRAAWRKWLRSNHAKSRGAWLVFDKKSSRADRLKYGDAVEEALCYGWIDSIVRPIDDEANQGSGEAGHEESAAGLTE